VLISSGVFTSIPQNRFDVKTQQGDRIYLPGSEWHTIKCPRAAWDAALRSQRCAVAPLSRCSSRLRPNAVALAAEHTPPIRRICAIIGQSVPIPVTSSRPLAGPGLDRLPAPGGPPSATGDTLLALSCSLVDIICAAITAMAVPWGARLVTGYAVTARVQPLRRAR
jgi:hypothetical protein